MTIAVGVVALTMALIEHWRKLLGKPPRGLLAPDRGEPIFTRRRVMRHVPARDQLAQRSQHLVISVRQETCDGLERRGAREPLAFGPVEHLEHFVAPRHLTRWIVRHLIHRSRYARDPPQLPPRPARGRTVPSSARRHPPARIQP